MNSAEMIAGELYLTTPDTELLTGVYSTWIVAGIPYGVGFSHMQDGLTVATFLDAHADSNPVSVIVFDGFHQEMIQSLAFKYLRGDPETLEAVRTIDD